jgi:regulator of replication initiation timing
MVKKDISNKENIIDELRRNINSLIDENNIVKDEIYKLTIKMYHYEQENQILKGDIMRRDTDVPQHISSIN